MGEFEEQGILWDDEDSLGPAEPVARGMARLALQRSAPELGTGAFPGGTGLPFRTELLVRGVDEQGARPLVIQHDAVAQKLTAQEVRL